MSTSDVAPRRIELTNFAFPDEWEKNFRGTCGLLLRRSECPPIHSVRPGTCGNRVNVGEHATIPISPSLLLARRVSQSSAPLLIFGRRWRRVTILRMIVLQPPTIVVGTVYLGTVSQSRDARGRQVSANDLETCAERFGYRGPGYRRCVWQYCGEERPETCWRPDCRCKKVFTILQKSRCGGKGALAIWLRDNPARHSSLRCPKDKSRMNKSFAMRSDDPVYLCYSEAGTMQG